MTAIAGFLPFALSAANGPYEPKVVVIEPELRCGCIRPLAAP